MCAVPCGPLAGTTPVPGDKSISHRSLIFGTLANGRTRITGLLEGDDVLCTVAAMRALGATVTRTPDGFWLVDGVGIGRLQEPAGVLDMGNSGTAARLIIGLVAGQPITSVFVGDASLSRRPMARVIRPLEQMGARFLARTGGRLPLAVAGSATPTAITYAPPEPSAQVKSAVLLAGLTTPGSTTVVEAVSTRDHTERLLRHFGVPVTTADHGDGGTQITVQGPAPLTAATVAVPGDPSSAAFPVVAAITRPGSSVRLTGVGLNPRRAGLFTTLLEMGADLKLERQRLEAGEPVADILVGGGPLRGITVPATRAATMIDEYPILAMAAACADGPTHMLGIGELRVKESDRLAAVAEGLTACGVDVDAGPDSLTVHGTGAPPRGGATVATHLDHRIAMAFLILGGCSENPVTIDDSRMIDTSFPGFRSLMTGLGATITSG